MSKPANLHYTIYQGATFRKGFRYTTCPYGTKVVNGVLVNSTTNKSVPDSDLTPVDLTGCTARMQLRSEVLAPDVLLELSTNEGQIDLSQGDGWIHFVLDAGATGAIPYGESPPKAWSQAVGQLELTHPNGDVTRVAEITFSVNPEGTR